MPMPPIIPGFISAAGLRARAPLLDRGGANVVRSAAELASAVEPLLANETELARIRERAEGALVGLSGALPRTVEALLPYLPGEDELADAD